VNQRQEGVNHGRKQKNAPEPEGNTVIFPTPEVEPATPEAPAEPAAPSKVEALMEQNRNIEAAVVSSLGGVKVDTQNPAAHTIEAAIELEPDRIIILAEKDNPDGTVALTFMCGGLSYFYAAKKMTEVASSIFTKALAIKSEMRSIENGDIKPN
jgi:hypothetical protein